MYKFIGLLICVFCVGCSHLPVSIDTRSDESQILEIFAAADGQTPDELATYMQFVDDDVTLMPHNHVVVEGKKAYTEHVELSWELGTTTITHELIEFSSFDEVVVARGRAVGKFTPKGSTDIYDFVTKNMFVFRRQEGGELKVWQVIFNMDPN